MKRSFLPVFVCVAFSLCSIRAFTQVGIGTTTPSPNAVLELKAPGNNQGFLVPRLTTLQRTATTFTSALSATEKGLLVFDTDTDKFYYWDGSAWVVIEDSTGTDSQTLSFTFPNLNISGGNSINLSALNTDGQTLTYTPATGLLAISGGNNVTITGTTPGGSAGGDLTGTYPNPTVTNNAITSAKILDGTITNTDINASAAIAVTKVAPGTNGQVLSTSGGVATWTTPASGGTVTNVATGAGLTGGPITTTGTVSLADGGVTTVKLADGSVTSAKILDGTVSTTDITDLTITTTDLADGSVTSAKVLNGTIIDADIHASAAIAVTKVAAGTNGQVLLTTAGSPTWSAMPGPTGTAGGDLTGTYPNPTVANNAVTSAKISDATIVTADLADASVTSAKVVDGALTNADINASAAIAVSKVAAGTNGQVLLTTAGAPTWSTMPPPSGAASGDLTGTYPGPTVAGNAITSAKIADGTIVSVDLADGSVLSAKILDGTIGTADLADGSVTSAKVVNGTIIDADINASAAIAVTKVAAGTNGQVLTTSGGVATWTTPASGGTVTNIATGAGLTGGPITTTGTISLADNGVTTVKLADGSVTSAKILDGTVSTTDITDLTIAATDLADGSVTSAKVLNGTIIDADINASAAIAVTKVAAGTNGQVLLTTAGVPTWSVMPAPSGTAGGDLNGTYPNPSVDGLQGRAVATTAPTDGQVLKWNNATTTWTPAADNSGAFTLPYTAVQSDAGTLLSITNQGAGRTAQFFIDNVSSNVPPLTATTNGTGIAFIASGNTFGVYGVSTVQNGSAGIFQNSADRGYGAFGSLQTTGTQSYGGLGTTYLNDGVHFGVGVVGVGDDYGIRATGGIYGGEFLRTSTNMRVLLAGSGTAVYASNGEDFGIAMGGYSDGLTSTGISGQGTDIGVSGTHTAGTGTNPGVFGQTFSASSNASGVTGVVTSTSPGGSSSGVRGINNGTGGLGIGVYGYQDGTGWGVYGTTGNASGYAGYFGGRVHVTGVLSKGGGSFKIDHPLDPQNKYLYHSFVESPDMKNIYDGLVVLDSNGEAEVQLPDWFQSLNNEFRYQLTCIGGHAPVYIAQEVSGNRFRIAGGNPNLKVSWQVTGIRKDAFAEKNRIPVEETKTGSDRGKYLHPEAFGVSKSMGINYEMEQGIRNEIQTVNKKNAEDAKKVIDSKKTNASQSSKAEADKTAELLKAVKPKP